MGDNRVITSQGKHMTDHLIRFAKAHTNNKPLGYLLLLWLVYRSQDESGKLSDRVKAEILSQGINLLKINIPNRLRKYKTLLESSELLEDATDSQLKRIKSLTAKNFRGFGSLDGDDKGTTIFFGPRKNIFYAPNGGGKTSVCEAIEYSLTGSLKEAERRRSTVADYIKRYDLQAHALLTDIDDDVANKNINWSTIFIDRNRLQEFSLLGSKDTKFGESDVLSALFGLHDIDRLVDRFVLPASFNLDRYQLTKAFDNLDQLSRELIIKKSDASSMRLRATHQEELIAARLNLESYSIGGADMRLKFKNKLLEYKINSLANAFKHELPETLPMSKLETIIKKISSDTKKLQRTQQQILGKISEVNFENLYKAITAINNNNQSPNSCPACLTDLSEVRENPYQRAVNESAKLADIPRLNKLSDKYLLKLSDNIKIIRTLIETAQKNNKKTQDSTITLSIPENLIHALEAQNNQETAPQITYIDRFILWFENSKEEIVSHITKCTQIYNNGITSRESYIQRQTANDKLRDNIKDILDNKKLLDAYTIESKRHSAPLKALYVKISHTKKEVRKETSYNLLIKEINAAYTTLHKDLLNYKLNIETSQINGIEQKSTEYYCTINQHDSTEEDIANLYFERNKSGYRIKIDTKSQKNIDAILSLSEGHLRSLGLSLLLAVAEKHKYELIVFDDVVNAIDSDHRANIINLLYNDTYLSKIQQIITTHDRLFWERYCNKSTNGSDENTFKSQVLSHTNKGLISIEYNSGFQDKIQKALDVYDVRQALIYCRIWFESFATQYCRKNKLTVTASFSDRTNNIPGNFLTISLEATYKLIEKELSWDSSYINILKRDLINWSGQNQVHHAFDESNYNFVHSKTSSEVSAIFEALKRVEMQLFPEQMIEHLNMERNELIGQQARITVKTDNPLFIKRAKPEIVKEHQDKLLSVTEEIARIENLLKFPTTCLEKKQAQG